MNQRTHQKPQMRSSKYLISRYELYYLILLTIFTLFTFKFNFEVSLTIADYLINGSIDMNPYLTQKLTLNSILWEKLSQLRRKEIIHYLDILFPDISTNGGKIEREFFFDKEKKVLNEYVDQHQNWPDETYIMDTPIHQKIGLDVVPGIKDVQYLIKKHQFPMSCSNKKFMTPSTLYSGFGSINHIIGAILGQAIIENRIFVWGPRDIIYNNGPFCGGEKVNMHDYYFQKMANRSHTKKKRKTAYYTGDFKPEGFDCFFEKITNCSIKNKNVDIKYFQPKDNHVVPEFIKPIIKRLKIPEDLSYYYWRLCASAFIYRENKLAKQWVNELEEDYLVNPVDHYDVSIHVRHGEKSSEMKLVYGEEVMSAIKVIMKLLNKNKLNIFVSTEDPKIISWFIKNTSHSITYFDFHLENWYPKQYTTLASVLVPQMLANMKHSLFSNFVIGTIGSNWNRLIIELRMTTAGYANNYYFEVGSHDCVSFEHCRLMNKPFHMNW